MKRMLFLVVLLVAPRALAAQAPVITSAGDPSVRSDTIYSLVVDSTRYPKDDYVLLLDDGVIRFEADGRESRTYRQVVQILRSDATERWGEYALGYDRSSEKLTINWARVLRPDGTVISAEPTHQQESATDVAMSAPVYSDSRVVRFTLGGVAPGTIVDYSYTTEVLKPRLRGDFFTDWFVSNAVPTRRSRLIVDLPDSITPRIFERNLTFKRTTAVARGRRVYVWAASEVEENPRESYVAAADSTDPGVTVAAPLTWDSIGHWYAGLVKDRYTLSPDVLREFTTVVSGARSLDDSLRALYKWVTRDFRYVSLSLGIGGYVPRLPAEVIQTRYGDCKDKAVLFIALARRMGVAAYPVLLSSFGVADRTRPSLGQFNHMIAAIERRGELMYLDLTAEQTPYGEIPQPERGGFALVVKNERETMQLNLPRTRPADERVDAGFTGVLRPEGDLHLVVTISGAPAEQVVRAMSTAKIDSQARAEMAQGFASGLFPEAIGESIEVFESDSSSPARIRAVVDVPHAATPAGNTEILALPFRAIPAQPVATALRSHLPRHYWINAAQLVGRGVQSTSFDLELPQGWNAELPAAAKYETDFATYSSQYHQEGRHVVLTRLATGTGKPLPPARLEDVIEWFKRLAQDDTRFLVLRKSE